MSLESYSEISPLERSENYKKVLKEAVDSVQIHPNIEKIILFGSTARGEARVDSDIDLYFVTADGTPLRVNQVTNFLTVVESALPGVDLQINGGGEEETMKFISTPSAKHEGAIIAWEVLYDKPIENLQ